MFKQKLIIVLLFCVVGTYANAQSVVVEGGNNFYLNPLGFDKSANNAKRGFYIGPHEMGDTITVKKNEFEKAYVFYKKGSGAYATEEKVITKTSIYNAINKVDKELTKQYAAEPSLVKKALLKNRLARVYDMGIKLSKYETRDFEKFIRQKKNVADIEETLMGLKFK